MSEIWQNEKTRQSMLNDIKFQSVLNNIEYRVIELFIGKHVASLLEEQKIILRTILSSQENPAIF